MASSPDDLEQHGGDDDGALDDLLGEGRDAEQIEDVGEHRHDGRTQYRAADAALTAEQAGAANDRDGDRLKLEADASDRLADGKSRHENERRQSRQEAADE